MKREVDDLARFGGPPAFAEVQHVGRPNLPDRQAFLSRVEAIFERNWLTNDGPFVRELERRLAERLGVRHAVAVANGTIGLDLAARGARLTGEVIVPSFTFVATAHALAASGITPVFCDIDRDSATLDPARVEERITSRTTGILAVHLWGRVCDVERLTRIAARRGLVLLFDAAHAFACTHHGRSVGGFGQAEVFSFHATKVLNTFEGGAVTTDDDDFAERLRLLRNFGFAGYDQVVGFGINGKMNEVAAAMGLASLDELPRFLAANHRNYRRYAAALAGIPGVVLRPQPDDGSSNHHAVVVEVDEAAAGLSRDLLLELLWSENVRSRRYFHPGIHRMEHYRSRDPGNSAHLPETERLVERVLSLPTGTAVDEDTVSAIAALVRFVVAHASEIRKRMPEPPGAVPAA